MRLRKRPWVKDEIISYTSYTVLEPEKQKNNWVRLFQDSNPIYIEIGTGRGNFIVTKAKEYRNINFIAIEQKQEVLVQAVRKAKAQNLTNIKFILGNGNRLMEFFGEGEISLIYLNFVDPWPKKRHAKRRLTHEGFLNMYKYILKPKGEIHLKTDNEILFEFSLNEASRNNLLLRDISLNLYRDQENIQLHTKTEYEEKFIEQHKAIFRAEMIKKS